MTGLSLTDYLNEHDPGLASSWPEVPEAKPLVHGWTVWENHFERLLGGEARKTVVEVGAWLGKTSIHLLGAYPELELVCIDTWANHGIVHERANNAFETWQANVWEHRDRVAALRCRSEVGMIRLSKTDWKPALVYVDACHSYGQAYMDTAVACACFPESKVCGDDFTLNIRGEELNVGHAVTRVAQQLGKELKVYGRFWELI